jgi:hypothetical protein
MRAGGWFASWHIADAAGSRGFAKMQRAWLALATPGAVIQGSLTSIAAAHIQPVSYQLFG